MARWFRWQGLAAFLLIVVLGTSGAFLFSGVFVKQFIESAGTKLVGARVELESALLSFVPLTGHAESTERAIAFPDRHMQVGHGPPRKAASTPSAQP